MTKKKTPPKAKRDAKGRYLKGATPGPGRPKGSKAKTTITREERLRIVLAEATPEKLAKLYCSLLDLAIIGDMEAATWVGKFLLPWALPPVKADLEVQADASDGRSIRLVVRQITPEEIEAARGG